MSLSRFLSPRVGCALAALALSGIALSGCSDGEADAAGAQSSDQAVGGEVRLGYFPNLTHATPIIGLDQGFYEDALAEEEAKLEVSTYNSGTDAFEAVLTESIDMTYIGPSPALTAYAQSGAVRIIAGAASGGAALVVAPQITSVEDLEGKTIATPSLGNTQDVAARHFLREHGLETTQEGGGDVSILPQDNPVTVQSFGQGDIDGGWLPEPYASALEQDGGVRLVDEAELWPNGQFVTTHLMVSATYLEENPELVQRVLEGHVQATQFLNENSEQAKQITNTAIEDLTGAALTPEVLDSAWSRLEFTNDPLAATLFANAEHAEAVGLLEPIDDLEAIYELGPLNAVLEAAGEEPVSAS